MKKLVASLSIGLAALGATASSASAQDTLPVDNGIYSYHTSPRWRESEDHPLRILSYIVHPFGWALREGVFRPISYVIGSNEVSRSVFGFREPFDFRKPMCFEDKVPSCRDVAPMNMLAANAPVEAPPADVVAEEKVVFPDIAFDFNKSDLNSLGKARVRQVSQMLSSMPTVKVVVEGHTDYKGSDDYNMKLGTKRADAIIRELSELGVDKSRMSPVSFGESRPLFTEDTDWARAANRRVQFSVQGEEPATTAALAGGTNGLPEAAK